MNIHKTFSLLLVLLLGITYIQGQQSIGRYKVIFNTSPQHVPTTKTPDAPLASHGDISITMGGTPDHLCFYIGKNDFWRAYPVYSESIALFGGSDIEIEGLKNASYHVELLRLLYSYSDSHEYSKRRIGSESG